MRQYSNTKIKKLCTRFSEANLTKPICADGLFKLDLVSEYDVWAGVFNSIPRCLFLLSRCRAITLRCRHVV